MRFKYTDEIIAKMFKNDKPSITVALNPRPDSVPQTMAMVEEVATDQLFLYDRQITDFLRTRPEFLAQYDIFGFDLPKLAERLRSLEIPESQIALFLARGIDPIDLFIEKFSYSLGRNQRNYLEYFEMEDPDMLDMMENVMNTRFLTLFLLRQ
jgi:hypothetical protein